VLVYHGIEGFSGELSFGVSLIVSARAMNTYRGILERFLRGERPEEIYSLATRITISLPLRFFTVGVICFGVAVLLNMFFGS
jgi:hypothetical protein